MPNIIRFPSRGTAERKASVSRAIDLPAVSGELLKQAISNLESVLLKVGAVIPLVRSGETRAKLLDDYSKIEQSVAVARMKLRNLGRPPAGTTHLPLR